MYPDPVRAANVYSGPEEDPDPFGSIWTTNIITFLPTGGQIVLFPQISWHYFTEFSETHTISIQISI
jgi:hypothetical protein